MAGVLQGTAEPVKWYACILSGETAPPFETAERRRPAQYVRQCIGAREGFSTD